MKLLRLAYCDYLGAGVASLNLVKSLRGKGIDAKLVVLQKTVNEEFVIGLYDCTTLSGGGNFVKYQKRREKLKHHIAGWPVSKYCYFDLQLNSISARKILKMYGDKPDIISVGWVTDFVSTRTIRKLKEISGGKVIYDMVDNAPITGGCHYPWNCEGYKHDCYPCPALRWHFHLSQIILKYKHYNITSDMILTGTTNDCNRAKESVLFKNNVVIPIVNTEQNPYSFSREVGRKKWGISDDTYIMFVGASFLNEERKGFKYFVEAMELLASDLNNVGNIVVLQAGEGDFNLPSEFNVVKTGTLNAEDLFKAFCCSDVFVCPSVEDSGPMMINYAFMSNIPVVCFKMGVALDLIKHKENGYIADLYNEEDFADGIKYCYENRIQINKNICVLNKAILNEIRRTKNYECLLREKVFK